MIIGSLSLKAMMKHVVQLWMSSLMATDLCSSNCEARLFVITLCNSDFQASLFVRTPCYVCENSICYLLLLLMYLVLHAFSNIHLLIIYFVFTNIHLFILRTNKPLSSLCLQVIETCQKKGGLRKKLQDLADAVRPSSSSRRAPASPPPPQASWST
jgi:hypothetical protein